MSGDPLDPVPSYDEWYGPDDLDESDESPTVQPAESLEASEEADRERASRRTQERRNATGRNSPRSSLSVPATPAHSWCRSRARRWSPCCEVVNPPCVTCSPQSASSAARRLRLPAGPRAALLVIEGLAQEQDESQLAIRAAEDEGALWLDLGDRTGRAVRVTASGWTVESTAPACAVPRTALTSSLPLPLYGELSELWAWLPVNAEDRAFIAAWLVAVMYPNIPLPGTAFARRTRIGQNDRPESTCLTVDPSPVPTRKPPRDAESWVTAASSSWAGRARQPHLGL